MDGVSALDKGNSCASCLRDAFLNRKEGQFLLPQLANEKFLTSGKDLWPSALGKRRLATADFWFSICWSSDAKRSGCHINSERSQGIPSEDASSVLFRCCNPSLLTLGNDLRLTIAGGMTQSQEFFCLLVK